VQSRAFDPWRIICSLPGMERTNGSNWVMQGVTVQVRSSLKTPQPRLRRQPANHLAVFLRPGSRARKSPDFAHVIGLGILLIAALLIVVGATGV
jgi:hypothetical protein